jgi:hypothetical protein
MRTRSALVAAVLFGLAAPVLAAPPPRDEALRLAPDDFALVFVAQNLRDHVKEVGDSPFAAWLPASALGAQILSSDAYKRFTDSSAPVLGALGLTPTALLHDIVGDAVVFAYTPAAPNDPKGERSVILIRPHKPDALAKVLDTLNDLQTKSGELKALTERKHAGAAYFERQKPDGPSDFYCFRGGVFAFTQSEPDLRAVIDRDAGAKDRVPPLVERMTKLGVGGAAVALLINPSVLDGDLAAKLKTARPGESGFLTKFAEVWAATDSAAVYLSLGAGAELGVSVQFAPDKLPRSVKPWLVGPRAASALWASVPEDALLAVAGRTEPGDVLEALAVLNAGDGKPGARETIEQALGPIVGRDKLPLVLAALGPDAALWLAPPAKGATLPVAVAAVKVRTGGPDGAEAAKSLVQTLDYGLQAARIAYNVRHKDQVELREEKDGETVIKSLAGDRLPAGLRLCYALKSGHLIVATSPDAIRAFKAPTGGPQPGGDMPLARLNAAAARGYLGAHAPALAKLLAASGAGDERALAGQLALLGLALEPVEKVELLARGDASGLNLMLRVQTTKPLKK